MTDTYDTRRKKSTSRRDDLESLEKPSKFNEKRNELLSLRRKPAVAWLEDNSEDRHLPLWQRVNLYPRKLPPLPRVSVLKSYCMKTRQGIVTRRATELTFEIEGLRKGRLQPRGGQTSRQMIRNARKRFSHLHDVALELGLWREIGCSLSDE